MEPLLSQVIDQSASLYPDKAAFRFNGKSLSYESLATAADKLARVLVELGVTRGDRVAIYLNKSLKSPVAIYGVMQAGAAYVPLDPSAPLARLSKILSHCGVKVIISQPQKQAELSTLLKLAKTVITAVGVTETSPGVTWISWQQVSSAPTGIQVRGKATDLAYIMPTSGSTGEPKGIMHTQASGLSYAKLASSTYRLKPQDKLSNFSPLHFDMSTFDYFAGPLSGACTSIIPEAYTKLPASLSQLIEDEQLTIWYSVPYALIQLLLRGALEKRNLSRLRWVLFGGEPIAPKHLFGLMKHLPKARFSNVYGPAEVNQCCYYHVPRQRMNPMQAVPIGKPWRDTQAIILDNANRPCPPGKTGELAINSPTMMSGYWRQEQQNKRCFYITQSNEKYYRTGDLVKQTNDGNLHYLGRKDRQIKIRGYRVELDEIEAVLLTHPQVEAAGSYSVPILGIGPELEAAVLVKGDVTCEELHAFSALSLPWYALPRQVLILTFLPTTTTGKIDRRALTLQALAAQEQRRPLKKGKDA